MFRMVVAFPVLPGKLEAMRDFDVTRLGPRRLERDAFEQHLKTSREISWLQKTPKGDLRLLYYEADIDPKWGLEEIARLQDPYGLWMKSKWLEFAGVDFAKPPQEFLALLPEEVFAYEPQGAATVSTRRLCLALPVLPGKSEALKDFEMARMGPRRKEQEALQKKVKISREIHHLQKTPHGDLLLLYGEFDTDFKWIMEEFVRMQAQDMHARWVRDQYLELTGLDWNKPLQGPLPEETYAYEPKKVVTVPQWK
jgi:hypothetical protein